MLRNRRIGCSVSGVAPFISQHGLGTLQGWLERGYSAIQRYDKDYSDWFAIPRSIKTTSVKPSGTVSLLAGATPGMHYPESRFYIRRMRLSAASELVAPLRAAGYPLEPVKDGGANSNTVVVEIPVDVGAGVRTASQVPMWEQLALAAFLQRHWADNQVRTMLSGLHVLSFFFLHLTLVSSRLVLSSLLGSVLFILCRSPAPSPSILPLRVPSWSQLWITISIS
jgi:ribonucleoside-triphosphate reductase